MFALWLYNLKEKNHTDKKKNVPLIFYFFKCPFSFKSLGLYFYCT